MKFIPTPKRIEEKREIFNKAPLSLTSEDLDARVVKAFSKLPLSECGIAVEINIRNTSGEGYEMQVTNEKITISADSDAAVFYAVQTLRQIYANDTAYCCDIEDAPDFSYRGIYHDVTRGKIPKVETLKALIDRLAYMKCNAFQIYIEHTFDFKELALTKEKTGYLTADEIREIDDYCYENFIEFIPSLSTFGHLYELLQNNGHNHLSLLPDYQPMEIDFYERMHHHTLDPLNEGSFEIVKSMIDQYAPLFRSNKFNICCDETFDLTRAKVKYADMDAGKLYVDFVKKIVNYVKSLGKTVMMWDDIVQKHIEYIDEIPEDVIFLTWDYAPDVKEEKITKISNLKKPQIVCPAVWGWSGFCERIYQAEPNITNVVKYGKKHGSLGVMTTSWGDLGHLTTIDLTLYGITLALALSWNADTNPSDEFDTCVDALVYREDGMTAVVRELSDLQRNLNWACLIISYINAAIRPKFDNAFPTEEQILKSREDFRNFIDKVKETCNPNAQITKDIILATEGFSVVNELIAKFAGYEIARKTDVKTWLEAFKTEWMKHNKPSEFYKVEDFMIKAENFQLKEKNNE